MALVACVTQRICAPERADALSSARFGLDSTGRPVPMSSMVSRTLVVLTVLAAPLSGCLGPNTPPTPPDDRRSEGLQSSSSQIASPSPSQLDVPALGQSASSTNVSLVEVRPGVFELGGITIDRHNRTVRFPAKTNLRQGAMEYFLVTYWGKTHESILRTDIEPNRIHLAMLLLGAKGAGTNAEAALENFDRFISNPSSARLPGDVITLDIKWQADGKEIRRPAEEFVFNDESQAVMPAGSWVYNGSLLFDGFFLADRDGSVVSLITDPCALINNVAPGHDNQAIWMANTNSLPPIDTPVEVTLQLKGTPSPL